MNVCDKSLGDHDCVLMGEHTVHQDANGSTWSFKDDQGGNDFRPAPLPVPPRPPRRRHRVREGVGLILLFLFAAAVFGFVAYVWQMPDNHPAPYVPQFPPTTQTVVPTP